MFHIVDEATHRQDWLLHCGAARSRAMSTFTIDTSTSRATPSPVPASA